ncbi:MAG: hypothetical protein EBT36_09585 [Betaproteobacteria bacterium]|nr:hypothetical protein [Betaproteobacteria bacterium]NBP35523.1 hypothetical protein [Betaproteobacteria bacterium]NBQ78762.1 hypothetical protein [Betaproteobacteria bacterium]NBQ95015.1 hypothetical protein [Betaproteobacteria bacterium]NBS38575.1 hypothetical protein [Betaproteobacteria bacterium]
MHSFLESAEQTLPEPQVEGFLPRERNPWQRIPLRSLCLLPGSSRARARATAIRPIGPGRCLVERGYLSEPPRHPRPDHDQPTETWQLEAWHMIDWMVSVQFRGADGKRILHHWLKQGMSGDPWYQLRRWLIWSGRRVEAIGQREKQHSSPSTT